MKSKQHIPPWFTKKIPHWAKDTKMDIDRKGKGREKEIMIEDGSMKKSGMSTTLWFTYQNKLINYWISDEPKIELGETYNFLPDHCGNYFQHPKAHLIQWDYCNINKHLIPPWKTYKALPTETVVLIDVTVNCWK